MPERPRPGAMYIQVTLPTQGRIQRDRGDTCPSPKAPSNFFTNIILHRCVLLFYKFTGITVRKVPFKRLALLGPAAIVDHFVGSGARRLRFVF